MYDIRNLNIKYQTFISYI